MSKDFIAVVGATGAVGRKMITELEGLSKLELPVRLFASKRSAGEKIAFSNSELSVEEFSVEKIKNAYVLMSAGGAFSKDNSQALVENECIVVDNSSAWRMTDGVPLIVPEVNGNSVTSSFARGIIANPNCSTIQLVVTLKPLLESFGLKSVTVSTYQSVSGAGQKGIEELTRQIEDPSASPVALPRAIAHDVIPAIDRLQEDSHCFEEVKMVRETRKILSVPDLRVLATTVRVPTFFGHGESVTVELSRKPDSLSDVVKILSEFDGIEFHHCRSYDSLPTPRSVEESPKVHVSRLRFPVDETESNLLQYWNVSNNLLKGAATNAVQVLKLFLERS